MFGIRATIKTFSSLAKCTTKQHLPILCIAKMATLNDKTLSFESRVTLNDNNMMPRLGLGTWRSEPGQVQNIVREAILNHGYRLIDGAWIYLNETEVGNGIHEALEQSEGKIKREDLFITTKLWNQHHGPEDVEWALRDSLAKLRLDYLDLYLIHWPVALKNIKDNVGSQDKDGNRFYAENVTLADTWKALEKLVDLKLTRSIGISNFNQSETDEILKVARIKPAVNQIELHPYLNQREMREYCAKHNIVVTSYSPLSNLKRDNEREEDASALYNPVIGAIAKSKNKATAQVILRWHLQHGLVVIPKTVTPKRLVENSQVYDFALSDSEMRQIDQLTDTHRRRFVNPTFRPPNDGPVFND